MWTAQDSYDLDVEIVAHRLQRRATYEGRMLPRDSAERLARQRLGSCRPRREPVVRQRRPCAGCSEPFTPSGRSDRAYCSTACQRRVDQRKAKEKRRLQRPAKLVKACGMCPATFSTSRAWQKFCSTECRRAEERQARQVTRV